MQHIPEDAVFSHCEWHGTRWVSIYMQPNGNAVVVDHGEYSF